MGKTYQDREARGVTSSPAATATEWPELAYRELVSRVVRSPTFVRSERLSTLLTYICDMSLKGRDVDLNEQRIGHAVFGRAPDYDSSIDGIVRTQASRLRQRLDLYFAQEGAEEPVRILVPKGGYVPVFTPQVRELEIVPEVAPAPVVVRPAEGDRGAERSVGRGWLPWVMCGVLLLGLVGALGRGWLRERSAAATVPVVHPLWSQMFSADRPTLVVPADSGLVMSHAFDPGAVSLQQYLAGDYRRGGRAFSGVPEGRDLRFDFSNRRYTSIVDLEAAVWLAQRAEAMHSGLQVRYARDVRPNDLKAGDAVLLGAAEANPWVELFERNMNFVLQDEYRTRVFSVINQAPRPGEPALLQSTGDDPQHRVYGVVAFTPNLSGSGNVLIVEGTSMAGTEAAWDFVSDDADLLPFLKKIQRPDGRVPHFQLLLGTQNMSSSAVHSTLIAWRVTD